MHGGFGDFGDFCVCAGAGQDIQARGKWKAYNQEARAGHTREIVMKIQ